MRLLDTDILIDIGRGHLPAMRWYSGLTEVVGTSGIAAMELIAGCSNKSDLAHVQALLLPLPLFWPTEADCRYALMIFMQYRLSHNLGLTDSLIAATAVGLGATLCTFNIKHFTVVTGLTLEQPYTR